jgi:hypothetical protein
VMMQQPVRTVTSGITRTGPGPDAVHWDKSGEPSPTCSTWRLSTSTDEEEVSPCPSELDTARRECSARPALEEILLIFVASARYSRRLVQRFAGFAEPRIGSRDRAHSHALVRR